jgi:3-deoxy-7-phosphoheptulonate synthase
MIIKVNTSDEQELTALFQYLETEASHFRYIASENIIVTPTLSKPINLKQFSVVEDSFDIKTPYQLASIEWKQSTKFEVKQIPIGGDLFNIMAGPCSVESEDHIYKTAAFLHKHGIKFIRGGAYKPRTSPYSFMGMGKRGLEVLNAAAKEYDLRVVTEIMDLSLLDEVAQYSDILQVGSRNMHNFYMLNELGKINKPILLKRGMQAKVTEWLLAAEYLLSGGNNEVILCERGIRSFDSQSRNTMDIGVIPLIKELSHLPIIADPSHGTGSSSRVEAMSLASAAAGANGLIIEIHPEPKKALSDSDQAISFNQFETLLQKLGLLLGAFNQQADNTIPVLKLQTL